jgi:hypothetical protein
MKKLKLIWGLILAAGLFASDKAFAEAPVKPSPSAKPSGALSVETNSHSAVSSPKKGPQIKPLPDVPKEVKPTKNYQVPNRGRQQARP